jgi:phenylacetate-coenzyme A ligase PaaK-like adenylate-forming protein
VSRDPQAEFAALIARILRAPSAFYAHRVREVGITGAARTSLEETLPRLPLTRRPELLRDQLDHLPYGTRRLADAPHPVRAGVTGTGPDLLVLAWSASDLARERAAGVRVLGRSGISAGMRVANSLPGALATPGSLLLGDVIEDIGALDVPLGAIESEAAAKQAWELIDRVQPAVLVLEASSSSRLFATVSNGTRDWWKGIIWLDRGSGGANQPTVPRSVGFTGWQRGWLAAAEASSFLAWSCAAGMFHVDAGVVAEVVNPADGGALPAGRPGVLALTPLGGDMPLLRYASGICARAVSSPCACGEDGVVVELM